MINDTLTLRSCLLNYFYTAKESQKQVDTFCKTHPNASVLGFELSDKELKDEEMDYEARMDATALLNDESND